ncbi:hypothetical protein CSUI_000908 [Cystoisospora suis]|uniref:Uncharacterized protein n=1 Tax=Cystoisospora suis TaxID=483139 RepID=A0A2C6LDL1_9APIC|nr:hypothetical protein CSUI_000908 [Cystoisospora suis]
MSPFPTAGGLRDNEDKVLDGRSPASSSAVGEAEARSDEDDVRKIRGLLNHAVLDQLREFLLSSDVPGSPSEESRSLARDGSSRPAHRLQTHDLPVPPKRPGETRQGAGVCANINTCAGTAPTPRQPQTKQETKTGERFLLQRAPPTCVSKALTFLNSAITLARETLLPETQEELPWLSEMSAPSNPHGHVYADVDRGMAPEMERVKSVAPSETFIRVPPSTAARQISLCWPDLRGTQVPHAHKISAETITETFPPFSHFESQTPATQHRGDIRGNIPCQALRQFPPYTNASRKGRAHAAARYGGADVEGSVFGAVARHMLAHSNAAKREGPEASVRQTQQNLATAGGAIPVCTTNFGVWLKNAFSMTEELLRGLETLAFIGALSDEALGMAAARTKEAITNAEMSLRTELLAIAKDSFSPRFLQELDARLRETMTAGKIHMSSYSRPEVTLELLAEADAIQRTDSSKSS